MADAVAVAAAVAVSVAAALCLTLWTLLRLLLCGHRCGIHHCSTKIDLLTLLWPLLWLLLCLSLWPLLCLLLVAAAVAVAVILRTLRQKKDRPMGRCCVCCCGRFYVCRSDRHCGHC